MARITRGQAGTLPARTKKDGFVEDYESDHEVKQPAASSNSPASDADAKVPAAAAARPGGVNAEEDHVAIAEQAMVVAKPRAIFETFTTKKKLAPGLCIVRPLGGGKYELVNLDHVDQETFSSEETGNMLKDDGDRLVALAQQVNWDASKFKVQQAVASANHTIFRFTKLPAELRFRIYDFAIVGSKKLIRVFKDKKGKDLPQPTLGLALMQTSKQMYAETRPFFYRNSFDLTEMTKRTWGTLIPDLRNTMRRVSLLWQTRYGAERNTFLVLQRFENLKELDLIISKKCAYYAHYYGGNQHLYQDNKSIGKFSKVYGFDQLVGLRGLDKVTVLNDKGKHNAPPIFVTHAEIEALQTFLQGILKEPKPIPKVVVPVVQAKIQESLKPPAKMSKAAKARAKATKRNKWEDDSEYEG